MATELKLITFRNAHGGYRCNQTNEFVPRGGTKRYRQIQMNAELRRRNLLSPLPPKKPKLKVVRGYFDSHWKETKYSCPFCNNNHLKNRRVEGQITCDRCKKEFVVEL